MKAQVEEAQAMAASKAATLTTSNTGPKRDMEEEDNYRKGLLLTRQQRRDNLGEDIKLKKRRSTTNHKNKA
jgi:hypothetical protein